MQTLNTLTIIPHNNNLSTAHTTINYDYNWLRFFSPKQAMQAVATHIAKLPSTGRTDHTKQIYQTNLAYFFNWMNATVPDLAHPFPDTALIDSFIAHLKHERINRVGKIGLKAKTISCKYLAPIRLYLNCLKSQRIELTSIEDVTIEDATIEATQAILTQSLITTIEDNQAVINYKSYLEETLAIPNPKPSEKSNLSNLYAHGRRLTQSQLNQLLLSCDISNLKGKRNLALLYVAFTSALRLSELRQITLDKIKQVEDGYLIQVVGKGGITDPVDMDAHAYRLIMDYVNTYNQTLSPEDPRYIHQDTPLWQPLLCGANNHKKIGLQNYCKLVNGEHINHGLSVDGIAHIIKTIAKNVLNIIFSPHDCRRTFAAIGHAAGMAIENIQRQLRHKSIATTLLYIGPLVNYSKSRLSSLPNINLQLPTAPPIQQPLTT